MEVTTTKTKVSYKYLFLTFVLIAIVMFVIVVIYALVTGDEWSEKLHIVLPGAVGGAAGGSVASRRVLMEVNGISDPDTFEEILLDHVDEKYAKKDEVEGRKTFAPRGGTYRLFGNWLGQEELFIKRTGPDFTIEGPRKYMDLLEAFVGYNKQIQQTH